ncbi:hypothetical protein ACSTWK_004981 [Escherichia coli]|nr:hypothetical protein [Shigella sonnei]
MRDITDARYASISGPGSPNLTGTGSEHQMRVIRHFMFQRTQDSQDAGFHAFALKGMVIPHCIFKVFYPLFILINNQN